MTRQNRAVVMGLFMQPEPRRFHHECIYADERKQRLREIEKRAKEELGLADNERVRHPGDRVGIRPGLHLRRRKTSGMNIYKGVNVLSVVVVLAVTLIILWLFIY